MSVADCRDEQDKRVAAIKAALRRMSLKTDARLGRLGEKFAKVNAEKARIPSLTNTAKYRVPDVLSGTHLVEVKNVRYQAVTSQLRDFLAFCRQTNRRLVLCLRDDARLSSKAHDLVLRGEMEVRPLGYVFTRAGQESIFKVLEPIVLRALADLHERSIKQR